MKIVVPATKARITDIVCDRCGQASTEDDIVEMQEFMSYEDTGGYGSVMGDGTHWSIDLCQCCVKTVLGPYIQIHKE